MRDKEYIERGAVLDQMMFEMVGTGVQCKAMDVIRYAPAADVVAVVRCKDCVHYMPLPEQYNYSGKPAMHCAWHSRTMNENGYCDEARRKENDMFISKEMIKDIGYESVEEFILDQDRSHKIRINKFTAEGVDFDYDLDSGVTDDGKLHLSKIEVATDNNVGDK